MPPLDGRRLWFVGIGGAGLSAYAQLARAWGAEVGGWDRVDTPYLEAARRASRSSSAPEPVVPDGWEAVVSTRVPGRAGPAARRAPRRARRAAALDRRRGRARQGDDRGDDRVRAARDRARPGVADRRAGAAARVERGRGGGVARRRGRRVRPLRVRAAGRDRGGDERRARPPHRVRVARRARGRSSALDGRRRRASCATLPPYEGELAVPGEHNRRNAGAALAALELAGVPRERGGAGARAGSRAPAAGSRCRRRAA